MTFLDFNNQFPTEESVVDYFVNLRFPKTCKCIHCESDKVYRKKGIGQSRYFHCNNCSTEFSVFHGAWRMLNMIRQAMVMKNKSSYLKQLLKSTGLFEILAVFYLCKCPRRDSNPGPND